MRNLIVSSFIIGFFALYTYPEEQMAYTKGVENSDLHGVIGLFKNDFDLANFEQIIRNEIYYVIKFDLNKDDQVDLVNVIQLAKVNTHLKILQTIVSEMTFPNKATSLK